MTLACKNIHFSLLLAAGDISQEENVSGSEERGETNVFAGYCNFWKQIELIDIVNNMKKFQELPQQSMINEIVPICKFLLVNPATITAAGRFNNDWRKVPNSRKERTDKLFK